MQVAARLRVDLQMTVGQLTERVEVTARSPLVETDSSQRGQVITGDQMRELALNGREYSSLALLSTGVRQSALNKSTNGTPREGAFIWALPFGRGKWWGDWQVAGVNRLEVRVEAFNVLNRVNFTPPNANRSLSSFGTITGTFDARHAHDTRLGRDVALKFLPDSFVHDPDRVARFRREAQVLAALNHPHIGAIYGLEEASGQQFLVLELVDCETLADRIAKGPLPLDEAFAIAKQIAEALEAAHQQGIIHRDLKPANPRHSRVYEP